MSKPQPIKQGYMRKYGKAILVDPWKKVFVQLDSSGTIYWYKKKKSSSSGHVKIAKVCEFFTIGSYCRAIPFSPALPSNGKLENMFAFPEEPKKKSKIHFFLCDNDYDFNEWISAIVPFFPSAPNTQQPAMPISHSPYSPVPVTQYPVPRPQGPTLGFEGLSISGNSNPNNAYSGYPQTQPYQQPYPTQPPVYPNQQPMVPYCAPAAPYPQQQPYYPQQQPHGYYQTGVQTGYPAYQNYPPQQPTYPYAQQGGATSYSQPNTQTIVIKEKTKSSPGYGKMAAGVLGGAVAGYATSRMFGGGWGGWGFGRGWGHGSWGSCSWSSRSWGSFSSCSWGSFG